ncbi:CinA family protein [Hymenobacter sediminicola]|uniref:CinA family protein n=1 Tax=Hymenobacter sediminicola TaxID=2761579 RepID=A0A7G7W4Q2_9BACT|nr:nicotinamide-nucleotide amidohydrolase family protein [Hymenobacter sediminicola]QNH61345.1 CinA family protein [Hymenobacter sediminicola]
MKPTDLNSLVKKFLQYKLTLAFAESCTAGLLASEFVQAEGSSEVLLGSVVTYHPTAKNRLLGVKKDTLALYTAESQQVTNEMVMGLHKLLPTADVCVAVTGLCAGGASESAEKPVGTMYFTILHQNRAHELREEFEGDCKTVRHLAVDFIFQRLSELLATYAEQHAGEAVAAKTE